MDHTDGLSYQVLVNDEDRHAIWPIRSDVPPGWTRIGPIGDKAACLAWIEEHWADIRPKQSHGERSDSRG